MSDWNLMIGKYRNFKFDAIREPREDPFLPGSVLPSWAGLQESTESFGKRLQIDRLPGMPGARVTERGRFEEGIRLKLIFWGPNYQARWWEFKWLALMAPGAAQLDHPVHGPIRCSFHKGTSFSTHGKASAIVADVQFVEDATELAPIASPELVLQQALADVDRSYTDQLIDMMNTVQDISRTVSDVVIRATTFTQGVFTLLDSYGITGTSPSTSEPIVVCPELAELYSEGAGYEQAGHQSSLKREG